jgi:hypothetical protein
VLLEMGWAPDAETSGDTALLQLANPPIGMESVPLRSVLSLADHRFACYGFRAGYDTSVPAEGRLGLAAGCDSAARS